MSNNKTEIKYKFSTLAFTRWTPHIFQDYSIEWKEDHLVKTMETRYISDKHFSNLNQLNIFCRENDLDNYRVERIFVNNGQIQIADFNNVYFFESPISIFSEDNILCKETGYEYSGKLQVISNPQTLKLINRIELNKYIMGVVPNEIGNYAPIEALKAQSITARTLAIVNFLNNRHKNQPYDVCSTTHCQVYRGLHLQNSKTKKAVKDTKYQILTYNNRPINSVYHSCCGGLTDSAHEIWGSSKVPYLTAKVDNPRAPHKKIDSNWEAKNWIKKTEDVYCSPGKKSKSWEKRNYKWEKTISRNELENRNSLKNISKIEILSRTSSGRAKEIELVGRYKNIKVEGEYKIRRKLGNLPSGLFYISRTNPFVFIGKGAGHGVGMCQIGAINMAREGRSFRNILEHYYENSKIINIKSE